VLHPLSAGISLSFWARQLPKWLSFRLFAFGRKGAVRLQECIVMKSSRWTMAFRLLHAFDRRRALGLQLLVYHAGWLHILDSMRDVQSGGLLTRHVFAIVVLLLRLVNNDLMMVMIMVVICSSDDSRCTRLSHVFLWRHIIVGELLRKVMPMPAGLWHWVSLLELLVGLLLSDLVFHRLLPLCEESLSRSFSLILLHDVR